MAEGRVLVVDDEADVRRTIRLTLTKAGLDVVEAEDGQKGIDAIRSGDNPLAVDTIICDMQMPNVKCEWNGRHRLFPTTVSFGPRYRANWQSRL